MEPIQPFWFKQRQATLEPAGENIFKAIAPNQADAYLLIRKGDNNLWAAAVRLSPDGEDVESTPPRYDREEAAWEVAFELYRRVAVV